MSEFRRLRVQKEPAFATSIETFSKPALSEGEVLVQVAYSSINYKDALATREHSGVLQHYPLTPGIDLAGTVLESHDPAFSVGENVLATGYGLGVSRDGGFSDVQVVPASWLVKLPAELTLKQAMTFGTAGFTAALAVNALEKNGLAHSSRVLVTGATGGVGGFALHFLQRFGCEEIIALTRKSDQKKYLTSLGATVVLTPEELLPEKTRPLNKQFFDFVIDTVGGKQLGELLPFVHYKGSVALCGNAGGIQLQTTVLPFILRGIQLLGIDSVEVPMKQRLKLWQKMATDWHLTDERMLSEVTLEDILPTVHELLAGKHIGRTLVRMGGVATCDY